MDDERTKAEGGAGEGERRVIEYHGTAKSSRGEYDWFWMAVAAGAVLAFLLALLIVGLTPRKRMAPRVVPATTQPAGAPGS